MSGTSLSMQKQQQKQPIRREPVVTKELDRFWVSACEESSGGAGGLIERPAAAGVYDRLEKAALSFCTNDTQRFNVAQHAKLNRGLLESKRPTHVVRDQFSDVCFGMFGVYPAPVFAANMLLCSRIWGLLRLEPEWDRECEQATGA